MNRPSPDSWADAQGMAVKLVCHTTELKKTTELKLTTHFIIHRQLSNHRPYRVNVEIAICTYNRSRLLGNALRRLTEVDQSGCSSLRVIVVDNNCTDDTAQVITQFKDSLNILALIETQQGQVHARNTAISEASGELLIWMDDDVIVNDNWLSSYLLAAEQSEYSFWGGPIKPVFERAKPKWIDENWDKLCGCYAERNLGNEHFDFTPDALPYGANFAIRTAVQKEHPFVQQLGRTDKVVLGEDELTLMRALLSCGHKGRWLPNAGVDHIIDTTRTTTDYIGSYFRGQGRALVLKGEQWTDDIQQLEKEMNHELRCFSAKRFFSASDVWLSHLLRGSLAAGQLESLRSN